MSAGQVSFCSHPGLLYVVSSGQVSALFLVCCMLCQWAKFLLSSWSVVCCVSGPSQFLLSSWSVVCCVSGPSFCSLLGLLYACVIGPSFCSLSWSVVCCVIGPSFCSHPGLLYVVSSGQVSALILVCCMLQVWPLPILFFGNIVFSLGGTKRLRYVTNTAAVSRFSPADLI